ncbi:fumarylacetoacetate hydrolase family protein, partial [Candidatus Uhrbacteria bacterium]|nr:fumarylacetoacetate hydrolase family protein [Candidatus Uhrbacteria bacterium]
MQRQLADEEEQMKFVRFESGGRTSYGIVEGDKVRALDGTPFGRFERTDRVTALSSVRLLAPCEPSKIVCLGLNYADHARETGQKLPETPLVFMKPSTAVQHPEGPIVYPAMSSRVDHEAELAIVIRKAATAVGEDAWREYVLGYTCLNDVTARDLQARDGQWTRAKGFDTFCPIGPRVAAGLDPSNLRITTRVNGVVKQDSSTSDLIFD